MTGKNNIPPVATAAQDADERREQGKAIADRLREVAEAGGDRLSWFDACYREARGDPALVPWGHEIVRPELEEWLAQLPANAPRGRALDIGCGLGDNAAALARAGFRVTAFDISPTAITWASARFADVPIDWAVHNLLDPVPPEWREAFDLVNETYTLQALRGRERTQAIDTLSHFVKAGGRLLIICRATETGESDDTPPWPLAREELDALVRAGLREISFEVLHVERKGREICHFRAVYEKPA